MLFGPDVLQLAAKLLHDPAAERDKEATPNVPTNEAGAARGVQLRPRLQDGAFLLLAGYIGSATLVGVGVGG